MSCHCHSDGMRQEGSGGHMVGACLPWWEPAHSAEALKGEAPGKEGSRHSGLGMPVRT